MNTSIASPAMNILKNCVNTSFRNSKTRLLKLKVTKSCHEIGETVDKRFYSRLNSTQESTNIKNDRINKNSTQLVTPKKYSPSLDILEILSKSKRNFKEDLDVRKDKNMLGASPSLNSNNEYNYNDSQGLLSSSDLSDEMLRMRLNYDKLKFNPDENSEVKNVLYKRFKFNIKHDKHPLNQSYKAGQKTKMQSKNPYAEEIQSIQNKRLLMDMMNTNQMNYNLNRNRSKSLESLHKKLPIDVRDLLLTKEKHKSQLISELQKSKQHFSRKVAKDHWPVNYKMLNKRKTNVGEFVQFKKTLDRKFFRNIFFKEDSNRENTKGLIKNRHQFHNKHRYLNTNKNSSTIYWKHNTQRSKSLDSLATRSQRLTEKSDFFKKFQLKEVDGRKSDMIKYFMNHQGKGEKLTEKVNAYCDFPASVPRLTHRNTLEPSSNIDNTVQRNIDTMNASRILKFRNYEDFDHTIEEPQYILCIKD
ncbi:uncharacterized protein LOC111048564 [Nilaparvata lugens]|uniref:uncharacterized protein LOC111048564 n=1 Tax=Nilaparvata lugens TaxID=108931 RepID=UPI00193EA301|nr:uncharacterized protein LOC111048564 [Nilaparvata lugens]